MLFLVVCLFFPTPTDAQVDLNPTHQLCQPCIMAANVVKNTNKSPGVKETEKATCNSVLRNDLVCNGAVEVVGIYLNWTPAQTICENFRLCSSAATAGDKKHFRAPARGAKRPDELAAQVLKAFETDEFRAFSPISRVVRQAETDSSGIETFGKLIWEHIGEVRAALQQFVEQFQHALQVYLDAQTRH